MQSLYASRNEEIDGASRPDRSGNAVLARLAALRRPEPGFPRAVLDRLREDGALAAPLPVADGGLGWGTEPGGAPTLATALRHIGAASLAAGRLYEAHVNALALIGRYASPALRRSAWNDARAGHLFGLWVTQGADPLRLARGRGGDRLVGRKPFCSGAGHASRAVVTFAPRSGVEQMAVIDTAAAMIEAQEIPMHGMRHTATHPIAFDQPLPSGAWLGAPGDYLAEPDFSAGAWRTTAVTAGGLEALVRETVAQLQTRARHRNPHQSERIGWMMIHAGTARLWIDDAARHAAMPALPAAELTACVAFARHAVERACLETITLVQRSLGLAAMMEGNPAEAMMRDLATYLRQPAGDEALTEAALHAADTLPENR